jgi:glycosyltransferase involved in cell wall biosynthesis
MPKKFDIIIPTYNNLSELKECLNGFSRQTFKDFRIIVCIDGSNDGTNEYLENTQFEFELIELNHPNNAHKGRDETRNLSLNHITAQYIILFDSDIVPDNILLQKHYELLEKKECISVGEIIYKNAYENIWAYYLQRRGRGKYKDMAEMPAYYLNTENVALRSKYFIESGGQDLDLSKSYGGDDTVLGYRIYKKFNIPTMYNKSAIGFSVLDKTLDKALKQMWEFGNVNLKIIKKKYPELDQIFKLNIMESKTFPYIMIRLFLNKSVAKSLLKTITIVPNRIKLWYVKFLVFYSVYKGYKLEP